MKSSSKLVTSACLTVVAAAPTAADQMKGSDVIIPSSMQIEMNDESEIAGFWRFDSEKFRDYWCTEVDPDADICGDDTLRPG